MSYTVAFENEEDINASLAAIGIFPVQDTPVSEPDYEEEPETWIAPPFREVIRSKNGFQIFADSGEVVQWWHPQYVIETVEEIEDAFQRLMDAEEDVLSLERKLAAIIESHQNKIKPLARRRDWIKQRMTADLHPRLREMVDSGKLKKVKYIDTGYGRYSVRDVPEKIELLVDTERAIQYCNNTEALEHLVVENVTYSLDKNSAKKVYDKFPADYWEVTPAEKNGSFKIETGLK